MLLLYVDLDVRVGMFGTPLLPGARAGSSVAL